MTGRGGWSGSPGRRPGRAGPSAGGADREPHLRLRRQRRERDRRWRPLPGGAGFGGHWASRTPHRPPSASSRHRAQAADPHGRRPVRQPASRRGCPRTAVRVPPHCHPVPAGWRCPPWPAGPSPPATPPSDPGSAADVGAAGPVEVEVEVGLPDGSGVVLGTRRGVPPPEPVDQPHLLADGHLDWQANRCRSRPSSDAGIDVHPGAGGAGYAATNPGNDQSAAAGARLRRPRGETCTRERLCSDQAPLEPPDSLRQTPDPRSGSAKIRTQTSGDTITLVKDVAPGLRADWMLRRVELSSTT